MLVYRRVLSPRTMEVEKESLSPPRGFTHSFCLKESWVHMWVFPKIEVPQNGWFIIENPIKMGDLGVPLFLETSMGRLLLNWLCPPKTANVLWSSISESHSLDSVKYIYIYQHLPRGANETLRDGKLAPFRKHWALFGRSRYIYIYTQHVFFILATLYKVTIILGGFFNSNVFDFHPDPWGDDPISRLHIIQRGWLIQPPTRIPLL